MILYYLFFFFYYVYCNDKNKLLLNNCQKYVDSNCVSLNKIVHVNISQDNPCVFSCDGRQNLIFTSRLFMKQKGYVNSKHIFATIQSENFIKTYTLPINFGDSANNFTSLSEMTCPMKGKVLFSITTNSELSIPIDMYIRQVAFNLPEEGVTVTSSPVSPWSKFYQWKDGVDSVFISVISATPTDGKVCAILHIQQAKCPLATSLSEIQGGKGKYQSFRQFGGTSIKRSEFPDGIFIVLLPLSNDDLCITQYQGDHIVKRSKSVFIQAIESAPKYYFITYSFSFIIFSSFIGIWLLLLRSRTFKHFAGLVEYKGHLQLGDPDLREPLSFLRILQVIRLFTNRNRNPNYENMETCEQNLSQRSESEESLIVAPMPDAPLELYEINQIQTAPVHIPITEESNPRMVSWWRNESTYEQLRSTSTLSEFTFTNNILIVAAFSTIPVYSTLKFLVELSDHKLDTCYFNRKCMFSVGYIQDFSKVFTNFSYIIVALALKNFISYHEKLTLATTKIMKNNDIGVCRQYSIFKVLAYELILQAFMSAIFHLCPNYVTIKFDIIFVFALAITFIGCIWSLRHSDFNQFTHSTFGLIGSVLFLAETKDFLPFWLFWFSVAVIHTYLVLSISFLLTKFGTFSFNPSNMVHLYKKWNSVLKDIKQLKLLENPDTIGTAVKIIIGIIINLTMLIVGVYFDYDIYSFIFAVCVINVNYYSLYYMIIKRVLNREKGTWIGWSSMLMGLVFLIPSLVLFNMSRIDYNSSPAESLILNNSCLISVFSAHDIWHFTSALTVFALFTGMLTIDDDLAIRKSSLITVF